MTKASQKLQVAKNNREEIVSMLKGILAEYNTALDLKGAMEAFLSASTKDCSNVLMVKVNGYQKVRQVASKMSHKASISNFMSESSRRQLSSSMR